MKKSTPKAARKRTGADDRPIEFEKGWHELEERHDRLKTDWGSLAALVDMGPRKQF